MSDPSAGHQMSEECNAQVQQAAATSDIAVRTPSGCRFLGDALCFVCPIY